MTGYLSTSVFCPCLESFNRIPRRMDFWEIFQPFQTHPWNGKAFVMTF